MEKELYLCKCVLCLSKNEDGTFVSDLIYTRHRKRAQILSRQDDENIDQVEVHDQDFDVEFHHNIISEEVIEGLKLLYLKSLFNFSEVVFYGINEAYVNKDLSLYKVKKSLERITGLVPIFYDMCENSCICYTGLY